MAHPPAQGPPRVTPHQLEAQGGRPPSMERRTEHNSLPEHPAPEEPTGPPEDVYPCGCAYPGSHKPDCMWSLWEQMRDNYTQTRTLMGKFMSQVNTMQETAGQEAKCECPSGCHGADLGEAMGLQQMAGVTVPWNMAVGAGAFGGTVGRGARVAPQTYPVENEARKLMEEQQRIKRTWTQFFNIFDMALDLANDVSKDRWKQNRNRKERQRLEREQRLEEMRKERLERQRGSKPSPPPPKEEKPSDKDEKENKKAEEQPQDETEEEESETPKEEQPTTEGEPSPETKPTEEEKVEEAE